MKDRQNGPVGCAAVLAAAQAEEPATITVEAEGHAHVVAT